jgi:hypothetical protein
MADHTWDVGYSTLVCEDGRDIGLPESRLSSTSCAYIIQYVRLDSSISYGSDLCSDSILRPIEKASRVAIPVRMYATETFRVSNVFSWVLCHVLTVGLDGMLCVCTLSYHGISS